MYKRRVRFVMMALAIVIIGMIVVGVAVSRLIDKNHVKAVPALTHAQAIEKLQWFVEQNGKINQADEDLAYWRDQREWYEQTFLYFFGPDKTKWGDGIQAEYAIDMKKTDVTSLIAYRNGLVQQYNAQSAAFDWAPFAGQPDLPPRSHQLTQ